MLELIKTDQTLCMIQMPCGRIKDGAVVAVVDMEVNPLGLELVPVQEPQALDPSHQHQMQPTHQLVQDSHPAQVHLVAHEAHMHHLPLVHHQTARTLPSLKCLATLATLTPQEPQDHREPLLVLEARATLEVLHPLATQSLQELVPVPILETVATPAVQGLRGTLVTLDPQELVLVPTLVTVAILSTLMLLDTLSIQSTK